MRITPVHLPLRSSGQGSDGGHHHAEVGRGRAPSPRSGGCAGPPSSGWRWRPWLAAVLHAAYILLSRDGWGEIGDGVATFLIVATPVLSLCEPLAATLLAAAALSQLPAPSQLLGATLLVGSGVAVQLVPRPAPSPGRIGASLGSIAEAATGRDEGESIVTGQAVVY